MAMVVADMSVSLDGFVADPSDGVGRVFAWYGKPQPGHGAWRPRHRRARGDHFRAAHLRGRRRLGRPPPHRGTGDRRHPRGARTVGRGRVRPSSFVTDGIESRHADAAHAIAGDRSGRARPAPASSSQCLDLGRGGPNPGQAGAGACLASRDPPVRGPGPRRRSSWTTRTVAEGNGVTHLRYNVQKQAG